MASQNFKKQEAEAKEDTAHILSIPGQWRQERLQEAAGGTGLSLSQQIQNHGLYGSREGFGNKALQSVHCWFLEVEAERTS